jgi:outer membrane lipoprotein SlyB
MFNGNTWIICIATAAFALPAAAQVEYRYQENAPAAQQQAPVPPAVVPTLPPAAAAPCPDCGTVDSVRIVEQAGEASGVGMVAGGVLGGLLGHQIGSGRGNTAATIIGAAGGAYAGHQVEKNVKKGARYDVGVRMPDGSLRTVSYDADPGFKTGERVRFVDGRLVRNW